LLLEWRELRLEGLDVLVLAGEVVALDVDELVEDAGRGRRQPPLTPSLREQRRRFRNARRRAAGGPAWHLIRAVTEDVARGSDCVSIDASARSRGRMRGGRFLVGVSLLLSALALVFLVSLATHYRYFHDDVMDTVAAIVRVAMINVAALGLGLVSVRQAVRYRRGDSRLPCVGVLQALSASGLLLTALFQLALDHH